jgi:hypothetical protein
MNAPMLAHQLSPAGCAAVWARSLTSPVYLVRASLTVEASE